MILSVRNFSTPLIQIFGLGILALLVLTLTGCDSGGDTAELASPTGLSLTVTTGGVEVTWTGQSDGVAGYNVYRSTESIADVSMLSPLNGTSTISATRFEDTQVERATLYFYRVTAVGSDDTESQPSSEQQIQTPFPQPPPRP